MRLVWLWGPLVLALSPAWGADGIFNSIHHDYQSPRALGMGDAFISTANDSSTIFYNPAGLARIDETNFEWGLASVAVSPDGPSFYNSLNDASNSSSDSTVTATNIINVLQSNYGKPYSGRLTASELIYNKKGFSIALVPADVSIDLAVHNQAAPSVDIRGYGDTTLAVGFGYDVSDTEIPGRLSWGATAKAINREFISQDFNTIDLVTNSNLIDTDDISEGYTFDMDLGLLYTPFIPATGLMSLFEYARPTLGIVGRDLLDVGFSQKVRWFNKNGNPPPPENLNRVVDVGLKFEFPSFAIFSHHAEIDVRDIGHPDFSARKGLHLGYEVLWALAHWLRGQAEVGVNEGYPTLGAGISLAWLKLEAVTYGEDVGSYDSPLENRMFAAKASLNF